MRKKRIPTRIRTRKIDRGIARRKLRNNHVTLSKRLHKNFANIWRSLSED